MGSIWHFSEHSSVTVFVRIYCFFKGKHENSLLMIGWIMVGSPIIFGATQTISLPYTVEKSEWNTMAPCPNAMSHGVLHNWHLTTPAHFEPFGPRIRHTISHKSMRCT